MHLVFPSVPSGDSVISISTPSCVSHIFFITFDAPLFYSFQDFFNILINRFFPIYLLLLPMHLSLFIPRFVQKYYYSLSLFDFLLPLGGFYAISKNFTGNLLIILSGNSAFCLVIWTIFYSLNDWFYSMQSCCWILFS